MTISLTMLSCYDNIYLEDESVSVQFNIKEVCRERGITLSYLAKGLGIHRSNTSAIASGVRGVSFSVLQKICSILNCSIDEIIVMKPHKPVYVEKIFKSIIRKEQECFDGQDKTWVHRLMLAQKAHYQSIKNRKS